MIPIIRALVCLLAAAALLSAQAQAQIAYAWGGNSNGELGNNSTTESSVPVAVSTAGVLSGKTVTAIAAGGHHSLALANGQVYNWGFNGFGQLGNNSTTDSSVPVAVSTAGVLSGQTVTAIAGGNGHSMVLANGQVYAWGLNNFGQLGNNSTTDSSVPVAVSSTGVLSGKTVTAIAQGGNYSLAVANGQVYAWGWNDRGQLGNNSTANSSIPIAVSTAGVLSGKTVTAIAAGADHSLAVANGKVYAWGTNSGNVPVAVSTDGVLSDKTVTAIAAGAGHSLAVANGQVYAWGDNLNGQLGNNSTTSSNVPVAISSALLNSLTVTKVAAAFASSYALTDDGRLFAWGNNSGGQLGLGNSTSPFITPQEVLAPSGFTWTSIDADANGSFVVAMVTPIPEPGTLLLVLGANCGVWRWRRRGAKKES